ICSGVSLAPAGTDQTPSPVFSSGTITGPFLPDAAMWMCAIVPATPVVVTLPLTAPSGATVIAPMPLPDADTGGTSWSPVSLRSAAQASEAAARAATEAAMRIVRRLAFMVAPLGSEERVLRIRPAAAAYSRGYTAIDGHAGCRTVRMTGVRSTEVAR